LSIAALDIPRGSRCLVPAFTFNSTVNAIIWNGLVPVFVDIDPATLNIDVECARHLGSTQSDIHLIVATHVFGNPADTDGLSRLAGELGARLIFDAAHAYGSRRGEDPVGSFGDAEVFSLSGTKIVTSAEGGIVTARNEAFLERFELARGYGFIGDYNSKMVGLNGKMSELHAALGFLSVKRVEEAISVRQEKLSHYKHRLEGVDGIVYQVIRSQDRSTYKDFALLFGQESMRARVEESLRVAGVQTKRYFRPCHRMDAYRQYAGDHLPVTESVYSRILCLPLFESLSHDDIDNICDVVSACAP
jgi:dTDP-4-amino-4,6-dideoxygalactose transaminase